LAALGPSLDQVKGRLSLTSFQAGQVIDEPGDKIDRIYFPTSGLISARALLATGQQMECLLIGRTNALGILVGLDRSLTRHVCIVDGHAWTMSLSDLQAAIRALPIFEEQLKHFSLRQMTYAVHVGVCNALHTAEQRVARWLLIAADLLHGVEVRLAQEELANVLGLQRSAVNPVLQKLKAEGALDLLRGRIVILNPGALERTACECLGPLRRMMSADSEAFPDS
jgi:CRP-like cAMP-binding protein